MIRDNLRAMPRPRIRALGLLASALFAACGPAGDGGSERVGTVAQASTTVCPATTVEGLDVSSAQGTVDWTAVQASGRVFAIIKATQGNYYTNDAWQGQWDGAGAAGLMRSAYHFYDPTVDGTAQAQYFLQVVGPLSPGDLPPMLDIECPTSSDESQTQTDCEYSGDSGWATASTLNSGIQSFLTYVQQQTGLTPLIYSYNSWFDDAGEDSSTLTGYPLVISWPTTTNCYEVGIGNVFTTAAFWQWSVTGSCPGVSGQVDLDRFNGTLAQLQQLAYTGTGGGGSGGSGGGATTGAGGSGGAAGTGGGGATTSTGTGGSATTSAGSGGRGSTSTATSTGSGASASTGAHGGCACQAGGGEADGALGLLALGLAGVLTSRRRRG